MSSPEFQVEQEKKVYIEMGRREREGERRRRDEKAFVIKCI